MTLNKDIKAQGKRVREEIGNKELHIHTENN